MYLGTVPTYYLYLCKLVGRYTLMLYAGRAVAALGLYDAQVHQDGQWAVLQVGLSTFFAKICSIFFDL